MVVAPECRVRVLVQFPWACRSARCGEAPTGKCWRGSTKTRQMATILKLWTKAPTGPPERAPPQRPQMIPIVTCKRVSWPLKKKSYLRRKRKNKIQLIHDDTRHYLEIKKINIQLNSMKKFRPISLYFSVTIT